MSEATIPAQGPVDVNVRPVAWLHDGAGRYDVVHDEAEELWLKARPKQVEHYTIPLYRRVERRQIEQGASRTGVFTSRHRNADMNKTMYEVNWHYTNDVFSHCSVTPIKVIRESVLPGCTGVSITAKDSNGRKFQGSPDNYYATEEAAWAAVRVELAESVEAHEKQLAEVQVYLSALREYLAKMTPTYNKESRP